MRAFRNYLRSPDGAAAVLLVVIAGIVFFEASGLSLGRSRRPGPGLLPMAIGGVLALTALRLMAKALLAKADDGMVAPRAFWFLLLIPAFLAFAMLVDVAGMVLASFALVVISGFASPAIIATRQAFVRFFAFAVLLVALTVMLFVVALGMPLQVWP